MHSANMEAKYREVSLFALEFLSSSFRKAIRYLNVVEWTVGSVSMRILAVWKSSAASMH